MTGELGKASLDLEANLEPFRKNMQEGKASGEDMQRTLDHVAAIANIAERALNDVKMGRGNAAETATSASAIIEGVRGVSDEARTAARELDKVKLTDAQAAESDIAGEAIKHNVKDIGDEADRTKRKLAEVNLASRGNPGAGIGPFGSGFGRIGVLGAAIGGGALITPAAGPATLGLLAAIPVLAGAGAGALGALALGFQGVFKAIGGNKKAFDGLEESQKQFVLTVRSLDGWLDKLKQTAASNLFPGLTEGLKSALSPGTVNAVTQAVAEFAKAIGQAGAAWGKYFGSAEFQSLFGPLMASGARNLTSMSDAALHLFDALGVLARAAIPLTEWMTRGIDAGARWADSFLHAKDATGGLSGAMNEAQTSLRLVGNLFGSLLNVVYQLGAALYPVSKVAVKDLTEGFNALAGIIDRNKQGIRDFVSGALAAIVSTVKVAVPIVESLAQGLGAVAHAVGGWKTAFEIVIGGFLASKMKGITTSVGLIGDSAGAAATEVGILRGALLGVAGLVVTATILVEERHTIAQIARAPGHPLSGGNWNPGNWVWSAAHAILGGGSSGSTATSSSPIEMRGAAAAAAAAAGRPSAQPHPTTPASSPFGGQPPWTSGTGGGGKTAPPTGANLLPEALRNALQNAKDKATTSQGTLAAMWLHVELTDLQKAHKDLEGQLKGATAKQSKAIQQELRTIDGAIASVNQQITANLKQQASAIKTAYAQKISAAKANISSAVSEVKATLDAQLAAQLQTYIDTVLGPKFFQGTDAHGMKLQTPAEAKYVAEQAADTLKSLQDAIDQAADPAARAAAQRLLDEYKDSIDATKERAQADYDYAQAVKQAQADEAEKQRQLNLQLDTWGRGLADGTTKLSDLSGIVGAFGLSLTDPGGIVDDFKTLSTAVSDLAYVLWQEAGKLLGVGDKADAANIHKRIKAMGGAAGTGSGNAPIDAIAKAIIGQAIPEADGGMGRINMPTLFFSKGHEDFAFSGEGRSFEDVLGGRGDRSGGTHIHFHGGTFIGGDKQSVARDLQPYIEKIVKV